MAFWQKLHKPILVLAPMAGVTDSAFRLICRQQGADVVYSEMASATALSYSPDKTLKLLEFNEQERPCVVQLFGSKPDHFAQAAQLVTDRIAPDGIDINFGCPVPKVAKQKAGAELMKDLDNSRQVIEAVLKNTDLPVSVKVRAKCGRIDVLEFAKNISDLSVSALMVHGRTLAQGFGGEADFSVVRRLRDVFPGILIANGGIFTPEKGVEAYRDSGADGLGIARGAMGNPWIFSRIKKAINSGERQQKPLSREEFARTILEHTYSMLELKGGQGIIEMRKHLCWYIKGLPGAAELRKRAVKVECLDDVNRLLCGIISWDKS